MKEKNQKDIRFIEITLLLILGYGIDAHFSHIFVKSFFRGGIAILSILLLTRRRLSFLLALLAIITTLYIYSLPLFTPSDDQSEIFFYRKSAMLFSSLKEVYDVKDNNLYPYLPTTLFLEAPLVITEIDPRYLYLILILIATTLIYFSAPASYQKLAAIFIAFCPEFLIRSLSLENHALALASFMIILILFPYYKQTPVISAFLIAAALTTRQQLILLFPYITIYLIFKKEYKFLFLLFLLLSLILLPPIFITPQGFYKGVIWKHMVQVPGKLWKRYKFISSFNALNILTFLGLNSKFVWNRIPWHQIQIGLYLFFIFLFSKKLPHKKNKMAWTFKMGALSAILFIFFSRQLRIFLAYYLILLLPIAFWNYNNLKEKKISLRGRIFLYIITSLIIFYLASGYLLGRHYFYNWCHHQNQRKINLKQLNINIKANFNYTPKPPLNLKTGFGFMHHYGGFYFSFFVPRGKYKISIQGERQNVTSEEEVNYYILKIPLRLRGKSLFVQGKKFEKVKEIDVTPILN